MHSGSFGFVHISLLNFSLYHLCRLGILRIQVCTVLSQRVSQTVKLGYLTQSDSKLLKHNLDKPLGYS